MGRLQPVRLSIRLYNIALRLIPTLSSHAELESLV